MRWSCVRVRTYEFVCVCTRSAGRDTWMPAIDTRLDVDAYARVWFRTTERLAAAQAAARVSKATQHDCMVYEHVVEWERSILHELRVSSVCSRYTKGVKWLLFALSVMAGFCTLHYASVKRSSEMQSAWGHENGLFWCRACNNLYGSTALWL